MMTSLRALLLPILLASACGDGSYLLVHLTALPASATTLAVGAVLAGRAAAPTSFSLHGNADEAFALSLGSDVGWLALGIGAIDASDCVVAWAAQGLELSSASGTRDLSAALAPVASSTCGLARTPGMVLVPAGVYVAGCSVDEDPDCDTDETPSQQLQLQAFEIDRTEVTIGDYADCVHASACPPPVQQEPTWSSDAAQTWLEWEAANEYCTWRGKALPTEAQWEAAARGPAPNVYPWGDKAPDCSRANFTDVDNQTYCRNVAETADPARVALDPDGASFVGALDMASNAYEWIADWYTPRSQLADYTQGPATGTLRVIKGGSALTGPVMLRGASRDGAPPAGPIPGVSVDPDRRVELGFRCAKAAAASPAP